MPDVQLPGDRTDFDPTVSMGPDQFGAFMIKSATYDHAAGRTWGGAVAPRTPG